MAIMLSASSISHLRLAPAASRQPQKLTSWHQMSSVLMWKRLAYQPGGQV